MIRITGKVRDKYLENGLDNGMAQLIIRAEPRVLSAIGANCAAGSGSGSAGPGSATLFDFLVLLLSSGGAISAAFGVGRDRLGRNSALAGRYQRY